MLDGCARKKARHDAVFLLHDVLGYGYDEIATIVGKTEANCRRAPWGRGREGAWLSAPGSLALSG